MPINLAALRQQAEAARGVNLTRGKGKHLPLSMSPEGAIELCDAFVALEARVAKAEHHNADAWAAASNLKALQAVDQKRAEDLGVVLEHLRERNAELDASLSRERKQRQSVELALQRADNCNVERAGRIRVLEQAVAKALDACFCDDGTGQPECARCQALRAVLPVVPAQSEAPRG